MPKVGKITRLPAHIRRWFDEAIVERRYGDIHGLTAELRELAMQAGVAEADLPAKSAVGEEVKRAKRAQESIAVATRQMQLMADTTRDDADKRGETLNALVSTDFFNALLFARESEAQTDPDKRIQLLNKAALAVSRLSASSVRQRAFRHQVEERAKAAADAVAKIVRTGGLTSAQVREIRGQILGITKRPNAAAPQGAVPA